MCIHFEAHLRIRIDVRCIGLIQIVCAIAKLVLL